MRKYFTKKNVSNIVFVIALAILLVPTSREWVMRQIAFSPSVSKEENREQLSSYNWNLKGTNTGDIDFETFKGKVIFVNFWATWCPPCRAEMPMIQKLYNDYKNKIVFIFVTNENKATVEKYFFENGYDLPVYDSNSTPPENFTKTNSIPASYLIDKNGQIIISKTGSADWSSKKVRTIIDELLKEKNLK
ncbi:TlpA disulfide reductase family protein [Lutibacter sp.]|uniref:TlpA family protein disulfide reductase n=1 Tax=Lutibacter sp. TaxID=1925666 RepID=UPI0027350300|nr:TlpA disulfide reductase family protein [Lutibacter sp.]MDP3312640.1 TlpA disulfide reductase family protein [Lutibacter sp.]